MQDVADVGGAPGVDRLVGVADDGQAAVAGGPGAGQAVLHDVGVLELVDQDVLEALLVARGDGRLRREQFERAAEQVVEVDGGVVVQGRLVVLEGAGDDLLEVVAGVGADGRGAEALVLGARDGAQDAAGGVGAGVDAELDERALDDGQLVGVVVDDEAAGHADGLAVAAQDLGADGVEGAQRHAARAEVVGAAGQQRLDAGAHLAGGLIGEGDGEDAPGRHAGLADEVGDAVGDDARLARPRPGQDEQRAGGAGDGLSLGGVERRRGRGRGSGASAGAWREGSSGRGEAPGCVSIGGGEGGVRGDLRCWTENACSARLLHAVVPTRLRGRQWRGGRPWIAAKLRS